VTDNPSRLGPEAAADANILAEFLALDDCAGGAADPSAVDLLVVVGSGVLAAAEHAFDLARGRFNGPVLLTGGIGHSTDFLRRAIAAAYDIPTEGRPEAEMLREVALARGIAASRLIVEPRSTNCGDNALQSRHVLDAAGLAPRRILLVQDPLMQRRTDASFRKVWHDRPWAAFLNWPTFVPRVEWDEGALRFAGEDLRAHWPMERFLSILLGEVPRLRDDASGYGPAGRGFIVHVDIPPAVEAAFGRLRESLEGQLVERARLGTTS
jgi:uncharacterized SAM-binding protein YcdF (DUF218 family)